jgi:amino acid transporter
MDTTEAAGPSSPGTREKKYLTVRQAAFIGVGAMVGAGIFALLGAAGEVAGAAVWLSFLIAGFVAVLQGYSFAKLGGRTRRPGACWSTWPRRPGMVISPGSPRG